MKHRLLWPFGALVVGLALGGCSSAAPSTSGASGGGGAGYGAPAATAAAGSSAGSAAGGGSGGNAASIDTCALLTPAEIQGALGVAVQPGVKTTTDTSSDCEWNSQDGTSGVGVTVQTYDDSLWQALSGSKLATPVSGLGEAAFKGMPHPGDISIKRGGYEIDIGIVDFTADQQKVDAADLTFANLVLSRL